MNLPSKKLTDTAKKTTSAHEKSLRAFIEGVAYLLRLKAKESLLKQKSLKIEGKKDISVANVVEQVAQLLRKEAHKAESEASFKRKKAGSGG